MDKRKTLKKILIGSGGILSFILLWEIIAKIVVNDKFLLPSFSEVIFSFTKIYQHLLPDLGGSFYHFILGLGLATVLGCSLGAITGWFRSLDSFFRPLIELGSSGFLVGKNKRFKRIGYCICVFWRIWPLILDQTGHLSERSDAGRSLYVLVAGLSQGFSFSH